MIKSRFNILVVDDTKINIEILIDLLGDGYNIIPALSGEKAINILQKIDIDLILLDIMMPDMDGFEVCRILKSKEETQNIPIIFITAKTDEDSIEEAYEIGGIDYITKPFKPKELLAKVKREFRLQELTEQSRMAEMGEMISMLAHQWRQPLSAIASTALNLELSIEFGEDNPDTKEQNKFFLEEFKKMEIFIANLTNIIDDFRDFYKPDNHFEQTTLKQVVSQVLRVKQDDIKRDNIELLCNYKNENEMIKIYQNQVVQVIVKIIQNAQENLIEKKVLNPKITISVDKHRLTICDNGGGIDKAIIKNIFDPYFSTKNEKNGAGLGLYMAKTIIEKHHNGVLKAVNNDDGVCFIIDFGLIG
ncbi:MAG: hybrid sensor histidine kinase/response regulator [Campylobacterota bacterium]|nr:hybrid sensor histidine kinase/response regulator [Campylobacterota bacterium]